MLITQMICEAFLRKLTDKKEIEQRIMDLAKIYSHNNISDISAKGKNIDFTCGIILLCHKVDQLIDNLNINLKLNNNRNGTKSHFLLIYSIEIEIRETIEHIIEIINDIGKEIDKNIIWDEIDKEQIIRGALYIQERLIKIKHLPFGNTTNKAILRLYKIIINEILIEVLSIYVYYQKN